METRLKPLRKVRAGPPGGGSGPHSHTLLRGLGGPQLTWARALGSGGQGGIHVTVLTSKSLCSESRLFPTVRSSCFLFP